MNYLYTYSYHEDERELCLLEMRCLFGKETKSLILETNIEIDPSRSPFIKARIDIVMKANSLQDLLLLVKDYPAGKATFKAIFINDSKEGIRFDDRRSIERNIGLQINGDVDLKDPQQIFAVMKKDAEWIFGRYHQSKAIWHQHQQKPKNYSTALSTRVARAVVNIAVPVIVGKKVIDPCCGIGTVLIEAKSMEIDIVGRDINPLAAIGARENIRYFGFDCPVTLGDIRNVTENYDVAIVDMPYNLCSVLTPEEALEMLSSVKKFAKRALVISVETIDPLVEKAGFTIIDRCLAKKSRFSRHVLVCE